MPSHQSQKFRYALLELLSNLEGDWINLNDAMEMAKNTAINRYGMAELAYSTLKVVRQTLGYEGLVESRQGEDKHWELSMTDEGLEAFPKMRRPKSGTRPAEVPAPPYRIAGDHMLPPKSWAAVVEQLRERRVDLIVVSHDKPVGGARYWDE